MRFDDFGACAVLKRMYKNVVGIIIIKDKKVARSRAGRNGKLSGKVGVSLIGIVGKGLNHTVYLKCFVRPIWILGCFCGSDILPYLVHVTFGRG